MKTLVAFYSRTGNTRKVGKQIAKLLKAEVDEIVDEKDRSGIKGWIVGGGDAFRRKPTTIKCKDPSKYDLVIVGTPIWAATQAPAVMTYLSTYKLKKAAFFCTFGGSSGKAFEDMEKLSRKPVATLGLKDKSLDASDALIKDFCRKLKG